MTKQRNILALLFVPCVVAILGGAPRSQAQPAPAASDWIVLCRDNAARDRALVQVDRAATKWSYAIIPGFAATLTDAQVAALRARPDITIVEPDWPVHALGQGTWSAQGADRVVSTQTVPFGVDMVNARAVWPTARGAGVRVAVLDTGIDLTHPDHGAIAASMSFILGETVQDGNGHGTHTSGTVAALDNAIGVVGVAPAANLLIGKVLNNAGSGPTSGLIAGIDWAVNNSANVINMSLGGPTFSASLQTAVNNAAGAGVLVVAAAGNDNSSVPSYPAAYASVVSVMAVDQSMQKASFSNFGSTIELGAPGVNTLSTVPVGSGLSASTQWSGIEHGSNPIAGSVMGSVSGTVYDCGLGTGLPGDSCPPAVAGNIAFIRRGSISFAAKVAHAESMGAVGVIIANNVPGNFLGTLGGSPTVDVVVSISQADGDALQSLIPGGISALVSAQVTDYGMLSGTSMASPHVAGVGALLRSAAPLATVADIRNAMAISALDLGSPGFDTIFGNGLVDAQAALAVLLPPCPGDANGDRVVNFADITAVVGSWLNNYSPGTGPGDANGDGIVDFADITAVVSFWLNPC